MGAYWNHSRFIRASEQGVFDWVHIDTHWVPMCTHFSPFGSQAKKSRSRAVFQPLGSDVHPIAFNSVCPVQTAFRLAENANSDTKCRTSPILSFPTCPQPRTCPCDLLLGAGVQVGKPIRCFERMPNKTEGAHMANEHGGGNGSARSTLTPKKSNAKSRRLWRRSTSRRRRQATPRPPCLARHAAGLMPIRAAAAPPAAQPGRLRFCRCFRCSLHPPFVLDLFGTRRSLSFV